MPAEIITAKSLLTSKLSMINHNPTISDLKFHSRKI